MSQKYGRECKFLEQSNIWKKSVFHNSGKNLPIVRVLALTYGAVNKSVYKSVDKYFKNKPCINGNLKSEDIMKERVILKQSFGALVIASALMLSACGEGWVAVENNGVPYGEERTAGSGIKYVRAYMLDEKGPVLDPIMEEVENLLEDHSSMSMPAEEAVASAEPIFTKKLKK